MSRIILFTSGTYADFYYYGEGVIYEFHLCRNDNELGN
ncbi:hypothetical protein AD05_1020 [Escherichia coli 5-366-08_S4_C2]|nr:hypothetical protein EC3431_2665 [Escherichia coli 3431]EGW92743.1 hypothetical protein ECSTECEH250_3812 [Escherichia coli STEC_EH250]EGX04816.1 hypothetical protein ECG581_3546 [Escherichia coli G58-1]EMX23026.1 hypothetical protein ECMP0215661_4041 [Escherichia coli MP021566.1]ENA28944.1 hypothetical protein ECBCE007MS11_3694 [Escherichia coli BCE007_MS-11]EYE11142.1 hypothetical protein AC55_3938 [Escherichia coli 1-110-08_S3_C3]EYE18722.1 hypothetical protein AC25_3848 [Escherichia col